MAIRTSATNRVPACATPGQLDRFLADQSASRGGSLLPRFQGIAQWYRRFGTKHRVRWDYAFFQMALETNFLTFRRGNGDPGDVLPRQNNFAGLGTTGGGVRGDSYPDVPTGVLAQIQHLVVYSGERLQNPVGHRTRLKQDVILQSVSRIARRRPVTFSDLARRWAADRNYGRSIQRLASLFYSGYCTAPVRHAAITAAPYTKQGQPKSSGPAVPELKPNRLASPPHSRQPASPVAAAPPKSIRSAAVALPTPKPPRVAATATVRPGSATLPRTTSPRTTPQTDATETSRPAGPRRSPQQRDQTRVKACNVQVASYGGNRTILIE
ncbi:MAG: glucosaminidase domain-containing protein, partial [Planctomycetales bacterium]|nr:glucosaminidase domain-containing protein [Planctomycetales bacterium]